MKNQILAVGAVLAIGTSIAIASPQASTSAAPQSTAPAATSTAPQAHTPGQRMMDRSMEKLNLTDAQKLQVQQMRDQFQKDNGPTMMKFRQDMMDLRKAQQAGDTKQVSVLQAIVDKERPQMDQMRSDMDSKFIAILTPDQQKQYQEMKAQRQLSMPAPGQHPAVQPAPQSQKQ